MKLKELITNDDGRMSTTSFIQILSALTLCLGFILALFTDKSIAGELGITIAAMATLTASSKGFATIKRESVGKEAPE